MRKKLIPALVMGFVMFGAGAVMLAAVGEQSRPASRPHRSNDLLAGIEVAALADVDATIATLQDRLRAGEDDALDLASLGSAYLQKARATADPSFYELARDALQRSLRVEPGNLPSLLGMGQLTLAQHDFSAAARWGRKALKEDRFNATAHGIVGDAQLELGSYHAAFRSYQRMIDLKPSLSAYARVSYARELTGDIGGAINAMRLAVEAAGGVAENIAWTRNQLGDLYFNSGSLTAARREYRLALRAAPEYVPASAGLARADGARGGTGAAISRYRSIVERYPLPGYVITLGDLYSAAGRHRAARRQYDLVDAQQKLFGASGVIADVEITLFYAEHDPKLALKLARAQYSERPSVRVADALGWALYANGRYGRARRYATEALRLGTKDASYHFHAGMIERALGFDREAERHLSRALEINPNFSILDSERAERALDRMAAR